MRQSLCKQGAGKQPDLYLELTKGKLFSVTSPVWKDVFLLCFSSEIILDKPILPVCVFKRSLC